jgi:hypothetical protein
VRPRRSRRPAALSPFVVARRLAFSRGVIGGRRGWLAVGGVLWGSRLLRRMLGRNQRVVATDLLRPGQRMTIEALPAPSRSERRAAKRSG